MLKKIASLAAMLSASLTVSACQTPMYKPIICDTGTALKDGRCQKVPRIIKKPTPVRPKTAAPKTHISAPSWAQPPVSKPKQNVYGTL